MSNLDEQLQRNAASMALLKSMGKLADEVLAEREGRRELECDWQSRRRCRQSTNEEGET